MELKRKKPKKGMETGTWQQIQTNDGMTILVEHDPLYCGPFKGIRTPVPFNLDDYDGPLG